MVNLSMSPVWWTTALYFWAAAALVATGLSRRYGRDAVLWCALGVFLGPLALALLYAVGPAPASHRYALKADDHDRWQAWIRMDPEIAAAAEAARSIGGRCEADLAQLFLTVGDRRCIKVALARAEEAANKRIADNEG